MHRRILLLSLLAGAGTALGQNHAADAALALGCLDDPAWPAWHVVTPPRRADTQPVLRITYRCSGLLLWPVFPDRVRFVGFVLPTSG